MIYTKDNPKLVEDPFNFIRNFTGVAKYKDNTIVYYLNGNAHRIDGPAVICPNGDKEWFLNGDRHREDGPAIELSNGYKSWWLNRKCYGENNDYTNESWIRFVKLELLK